MLRETENATSRRKLHVDAVSFEGTESLTESDRAELTKRFEEISSDCDNIADCIDYCRESVVEALQNRGYYFAKVSGQARFLSRDPAEERVSFIFHVVEGPQYRLGEIEFANAHAFAVSELRSNISLRGGDIFDLRAIRVGIEALIRLYGSQGYINTTVNPDVRVDNAHQRISVLLDMSEDKQFRVRSVEVLASDPRLSAQALNLKLKPGDIFNTNLLEDFYSAMKPFLPADASPREDTDIHQDPRNNTVAIVFDFRGCP